MAPAAGAGRAPLAGEPADARAGDGGPAGHRGPGAGAPPDGDVLGRVGGADPARSARRTGRRHDRHREPGTRPQTAGRGVAAPVAGAAEAASGRDRRAGRAGRGGLPSRRDPGDPGARDRLEHAGQAAPQGEERLLAPLFAHAGRHARR